MPTELFHKIIDDIATIPIITGINLQGLNEPLLDNRLEDFIRYALSKNPRLGMGIYTNGFLLTPARYDSLKASGLSRLIVSLNACDQEQHEDIMGVPGMFDKVCSHIEYAAKNPVNTVNVHAVFGYHRFNAKDVDRFYDRWGNWMEGMGIGLVCRQANWSGDMYVNKQRGIPLMNKCCSRAIRHISITCEGKVTTCCMDPFGKQVFGNLNHQTLREIYNSEEYVRFRKAHSNDEADQYELCRNCTRI